MKILIADDDLTSLTYTSGILKTLGYDVVKCEDGAQALEALLWVNAPKIALLDWMMPKKTGLDVCHEVRQKKSLIETYIILLTGRSTTSDITEGLASGANDYIVKPFQSEELKARVQIAAKTMLLYDEIKILQGLLPICAWCKSIRNDGQLWESVESYLSRRSKLEFTHCLCEKCRDQLAKEKG